MTTPDTEPALPHARAWARRGHGVFPLYWPVTHNGQTVCACGRLCGKQAAKHPIARYAPHGHLSATTNDDTIKQWWELCVPQANLAVATEKLIVIDNDPRHGGDESLAALEREHGELPRTWVSLTGGGGEHRIYAAPDDVAIASFSAANCTTPPLGPGIDIRARGGYIAVPPSRHISGRAYSWNVDFHPADTPLAPSPDWLIERLTRARGTNSAKGHDPAQWAADKEGKFEEYRDRKIAEIAGKLLRAISLDPRFVATLVHDYNACHCVPPLPEDEVQDIFNRICRRERQRLERDHA
jgi:hypothetical protein